MSVYEHQPCDKAPCYLCGNEAPTDHASNPDAPSIADQCERCGGETYIDAVPSTFGGHPKIRCPECKPGANPGEGR
jgi:hypothetical protein